MAFVVEDGTAKPNANSFADLATIRAYAADRGIDLSAPGTSDAALQALAVKATDYLASFAKQYVGQPTTITQALPWPRTGVINSDGTAFPDNDIPDALVNACCQLCIEENNGVNLQRTSDYGASGFVVRSKVDVIETQFSERIGTSKAPLMPAVDRWLDTLLAPRASGLAVVRV